MLYSWNLVSESAALKACAPSCIQHQCTQASHHDDAPYLHGRASERASAVLRNRPPRRPGTNAFAASDRRRTAWPTRNVK